MANNNIVLAFGSSTGQQIMKFLSTKPFVSSVMLKLRIENNWSSVFKEYCQYLHHGLHMDFEVKKVVIIYNNRFSVKSFADIIMLYTINL